jgi:hypothetical protein
MRLRCDKNIIFHQGKLHIKKVFFSLETIQSTFKGFMEHQ